MNNEDIESLKQIYASGIEIEVRILPDDEKNILCNIYLKKNIKPFVSQTNEQG